jgi:hypothetical protein
MYSLLLSVFIAARMLRSNDNIIQLVQKPLTCHNMKLLYKHGTDLHRYLRETARINIQF